MGKVREVTVDQSMSFESHRVLLSARYFTAWRLGTCLDETAENGTAMTVVYLGCTVTAENT